MRPATTAVGAGLLPLLPPRGVPARGGRGAPFASKAHGPLEGNAAIPYLALGRLRDAGLPVHLVRAEPFVGLPYLATFGFKVARPLPVFLQRVARAGERAVAPFTRWLATRIFVVLEKPA